MKIEKNEKCISNQTIDAESYPYDDVESIDDFLSTKFDI